MCKGHQYGTGCTRTAKSPKSRNWLKHQLCHDCFMIAIMQKKPHKGHGGKYLREGQKGMSLITQ